MKKQYAIDLFAGAGGMALGLKMAGFDIALANEIDSIFCKTYKQNHPETIVLEADIQKVNFEEEIFKLNLKNKVALVFGGSPCQGFSTLGKKEKTDLRNILFLEFIRAAKETSPEFILFENVSGFKKMYNGEMFNTLIKELETLNYIVHYKLVNAVNFGLPQLRERTVVVGHKSKYKFKIPEGNFSEGVSLFEKNNAMTLRDAISDLPKIKSGQEENKYASVPKNEYQKKLRNGCNVLTEHSSPLHGKKLLHMISYVPYGGSIEDVPKNLRPKGYFKNTYSRLIWEAPTPTITRNFGTPSSSRCIHPEIDRGLTTREGARIQGFPDNYFFVGTRQQKNLQIGNAVPPILGYKIGKEIFKQLNK